MHVVIHTASPPHGKPRDVYFKVNVEGTRNVINACVERKVKKLVYTSSLSVVYYGQNLVNVDETEPYCTTHMDPYNETKQMAEIAVLKANGNGGLLTCAIRPTGIFGPRDGQASFELMKAAKDGHWRLQVGENNHLYDWTYVDNVAHIHVLAALKMEKDNGIAGEAFFVTNDQPIQFWDFSKYLYNGLGYRQTQYIYLPMFLAFIIADIMDFLHSLFNIPMPLSRFKLLMIHCNVYFNISKAKRLLGYQPIVTFQDGMDRTVEYWKTQGYGNQI
ncbi:3-beta hydroxysteroid dehydrogenase/isomerase family-domain-containing protein, partial [Globomyces pollinis-pini]